MSQFKAFPSRKCMLIFGMLILVCNSTDTSASTQGDDLIAAAVHGDLARVNELLAKGADVNARGRNGDTALIEASAGVHPEVVQILLSHGADVNAIGDFGTSEGVKGFTALDAAKLSGHYDVRILVLLVRAGALTRRMISWHTPPFTQNFPDLDSLAGAVIHDDLAALRTDLSSGQDPNKLDDRGWTPLIEAANSGNIEAACLLLDAGAAIDAKANDGSTALGVAARNHRDKMADYLSSRGATGFFASTLIRHSYSFLYWRVYKRIYWSVYSYDLLPYIVLLIVCGMVYIFSRAGAIPRRGNGKPIVRPVHILMWLALMFITHPWTFKTQVNPVMTTVVIGAIAAYCLVEYVK